jgi:two-component system, OmpR family, sensor kinase
MFLPLPFRLTLFYTLLLVLALSGFGLLVYHQAESRAYNDLDALLSTRAASVELGKDLFSKTSSSNPDMPVRLPGVNELGTDGVAIEVLDAKLNLLASTNTTTGTGINVTIAGINASPVPWDSQAAKWILAHHLTDARTPNSRYDTTTYEGQYVRVYTTVNTVLGSIQVIQTASAERSLQQSLDELRQTLLSGGLLFLLLALGGGLCLTWSTLAAVRRVTQTAREISASQDFKQRVSLKRNVGRDEIAELAETFNMMLANLESAYQQQKRFTADASHELRAPLTSICCNLDLLARAPDLPAGERDAALADTRAEADRMGRLVNDLLILARADERTLRQGALRTTDQGSRNKAPRIDLDSLLLEVFRQYRGASAEQNEVNGPHLILQHIAPAQVSGQADQLKQVLVILLDNGLKYTPAEGSVTLSLSVDRREATLKVSDTGFGIAPEALPHIFERFYRADRGRSREEGGSGLGLAIAQSIVQEHQGRIEVESVLGQGSTFSVHLPCAQDSQAEL